MVTYQEPTPTHSCHTPTLESFNGHIQTLGHRYEDGTIYTCPECGWHWAVKSSTVYATSWAARGTRRWWTKPSRFNKTSKRMLRERLSVPPPPASARVGRASGESVEFF